MNNKLALPIIIILLVASAALLALLFGNLWQPAQDSESQQQEEQPADLEQVCLASGGKVMVGSCCKSSEDFPNLCLIGACGCGPQDSHDIRFCYCGEQKCFDGQKCVAPSY